MCFLTLNCFANLTCGHFNQLQKGATLNDGNHMCRPAGARRGSFHFCPRLKPGVTDLASLRDFLRYYFEPQTSNP